MNISPTPPTPQRPFLKSRALPKGGVGKWYLPAMAMIALGFGVTNYLTAPSHQSLPVDPAEEERLRKNKELMDAYGDKDTVQDLSRAVDWYELQ